VARHPAGDHVIVIGQVADAGVRDGRPLLYYRGGYAQLER
jgi:flavin reductase (DIM6/NTAB) family NADH-FMN oxidoreductase RutF